MPRVSRKPPSLEVRVCRELGITSAGLRALAKFAALGRAEGDGVGNSAASARPALVKRGLVELDDSKGIGGGRWVMSEAGRQILERARALGW